MTPPPFPSVCPQARVSPSCGRLVGFSSGPVNPHGVTAVTSGRRCALALWFTKEKPYRDMVSVPIAPAPSFQPRSSAGCCRDNRGYHQQLDYDANVAASSHAVAFTFAGPPSLSARLTASSHACLVDTCPRSPGGSQHARHVWKAEMPKGNEEKS